MTDLEALKYEWQRLSLENEALERKNRELTLSLVHQRVKTGQQRLAQDYKLGYWGFFFPFFGLILYKLLYLPVWLCIFYSVFGIIEGALQIYFMNYLLKLDYTSMPTVDAIRVASKIVLSQNRGVLISVIAAIMLLIPLFYEFTKISESVVIGGLTGLVFGSVIGLKRFLKNRRLAKQILEELKGLKTES